MKKYLVSIGVVFVVLMASLTAFGKDEEKKGKRPGKGGKEAP